MKRGEGVLFGALEEWYQQHNFNVRREISAR